MEPSRELIDEIYRDRVRRAREMPPEEKLCAGIELFEEACQRMRDGIRMQFPSADAAEIERRLRQRLKRLRQVEEPHGREHRAKDGKRGAR